MAEFPGYERFFVLDEAFRRDAIRAELDVNGYDDRAIVRGEVVPAGPIRASRASGTAAYDLVGTTLATPLLVGERLEAVLEAEGFTGWSTYPIASEDAALAPYSGFAVTGRAGPEDTSRARVALTQAPGGIFPTYYGVFFDADSWDRSDVFITDGDALWIIVAERVRDAIEAAALTNVSLTALPDVEQATL